MKKPPELRTFLFQDDGTIPNNRNLPVVLYPGALKGQADHTESLFNRHSWRNSWTNGVFPYHHYHSNAHEVLGVIRGSVTLQLGGEQGKQVELHAGDVVVLPAGTGHKRLGSSGDFQIVGAYPGGMDYNVRTGEAGERPQVLQEIDQVPLPDADPVFGESGPLLRLWKGLF
ncbi:cupin domain-containing protein [Paenibacillus nasutitermitis]|uniref:Cupin type-2 domain-containing protein n=1 Tax=Paenibacillus nasutitermitis TaxID=1652958 RepID=A0A916ZDA3_9BACL|nr:cupin domain-containing protein [Paenibacillus nasutitermitis]GGD90160.1 hypothetical protein GCM10010911_56020 [Paenibacillus nasutitermitis]